MHTFYLMDGEPGPSLQHLVAHSPAAMPGDEERDRDDDRDWEPRNVEEEEGVHRVPRGRAEHDDDRQQDEGAEDPAAASRPDVGGGRAAGTARPRGRRGPRVGQVV